MIAAEATASRYAAALLQALGVDAACDAPRTHPALGWAQSGLMTLTGNADGPGMMLPLPLTACADGALAALATLAPAGAFDGLCGSALLAERAAIAGHRRRGAISPGGACRLLPTSDGHIAFNLARDDDRALLPAWLQHDDVSNDERLAVAVAAQTMHELVERGRELGLAVAPLVPPPSRPTPWLQTVHTGPRARRQRPPRVVDLSSLWAGPLCTQLLQRCGADVVKVESQQRPDGARRGPAAFYDLLNAGKRSVALDFSSEHGRSQLKALLAQADIVIEASRPRALRQLGIDAEALIDQHPGLSWISLNGYGRGGAAENWIAYGDDAGVAAGLSWVLRQASGQTLFVGDAIADPFTGLHAALAAWHSLREGGGRLLSLSLVEVLRHVIQFEKPAETAALRAQQQQWTQLAAAVPAVAPSARALQQAAAALGADTAAVLRDWGVAC